MLSCAFFQGDPAGASSEARLFLLFPDRPMLSSGKETKMNNNENKQYTVYIRSTDQWIPVTKEQFDNFYDEASVFRRKQQRHGCCICPQSKRLMCDTDCDICPYRVNHSDTLSLDAPLSENEEGEECTFGDVLPDGSPLIDEMLADKEELDCIFARICELLPDALRIGEARLEGKPDYKIAEELGIGRKALAYRIKQAKEVLEKEFPNFF